MNTERNLQNNQDKFSGLVKILTPQGTILMKIEEALVFAGGEILKSYQIPRGSEDDVLNRKEELVNYLQEQETHETSGRQLKLYRKIWDEEAVERGDSSIFTLLPKNLERGLSLARRAIHILFIAGIETREELIKLSDEKIMSIDRAGEKVAPLIIKMRNYAISLDVLKISKKK